MLIKYFAYFKVALLQDHVPVNEVKAASFKFLYTLLKVYCCLIKLWPIFISNTLCRLVYVFLSQDQSRVCWYNGISIFYNWWEGSVDIISKVGYLQLVVLEMSYYNIAMQEDIIKIFQTEYGIGWMQFTKCWWMTSWRKSAGMFLSVAIKVQNRSLACYLSEISI